ncbi:helicase-like transcription factor CHR28 isoform X1, partial [Olea europaea subsp. europaea]
GLGKTISTIALVLKEWSPTAKASKVNEEQCKAETLNLDEDDGVSGIYQLEQGAKSCQADGSPISRTRANKGQATCLNTYSMSDECSSMLYFNFNS